MPIIAPSEFEPPSRPAPVWSCGPVRIDGDDLVLDRENATTYRVAEKPEIHDEFAAIRDIDDAARFATEFGLLYHGALPRGTVPDAVTDALHRWRNEDEIRDPREPYGEWMHEVARINRIRTVYWLVSGTWGEPEFEELLSLYDKWISTDLRWAAVPKDQQEAIDLAAEYVCRMVNDWFDRTRTILDLGRQARGPGQVARPTFDLAMESPLSLLGYIYFRQAQDFAGGANYGRCPGCSTIFKMEVGDRRKYHTPQCAQRTRYRRYVDRHPGYRRRSADRSD